MNKFSKPNIQLKRKADKYIGYFLFFLIVPLVRLLGILLKRNHQLNNPPKTILFIKLLGLGSLVISIPAIQEIRKKYPEAKLILLTDSNIRDGIAPFDLFDEFWPIKTSFIFITVIDSLRFIIKSWQIRKLWVVDLEVYSKLTTVYSLFTFAINRFGFLLSPVLFRKYLNTHNVLFNQSAFLGDNYLYMAEIITDGFIRLDSGKQNKRLHEYTKPFIALNNTCSELATVRKLPDGTFIFICEWIIQNTSYNIALLGSIVDRYSNNVLIDSNTILSVHKNRILNYAGSVIFEDYYNFLSEQCVCLITIDSGPLHIAKALGLPTLSIWGPTNPANYSKIQADEQIRHQYHYLKVQCSPCVHFHEKLPCGGNNFCMKNIEAEAIISKIETLLNHLKYDDSN